jgi:hypothetical protein
METEKSVIKKTKTMTSKEKAPIVILNVSRTIFSIARHYGGCKAYGTEYFYQPIQDALIRKDWMKTMKSKTWDEFLETVKAEKL